MAVDRDRIERLVRESLALLGEHRGETYRVPTIRWDLRGTSCLGQAIGTTVIRLHPEAAEKLGAEYDVTVIHELCHTAAEFERRRGMHAARGSWTAHGGVWRSMMRTLGQVPSRCAVLPADVTLTPARKVERFEAVCGCRTHVIGKTRVNRGLANYRCRTCGQTLILKGRVA